MLVWFKLGISILFGVVLVRLSLDLWQQVVSPSLEVWVVVNLDLSHSVNLLIFLEVVDVELSHE